LFTIVVREKNQNKPLSGIYEQYFSFIVTLSDMSSVVG